MFIIFNQENKNAEINIEILILKEVHPVTSYVTATFHPTIGQCSHQSLSNNATPELGMIPQGIRETLAGSHVAKDTQNSVKPTQLGLSG